MIGIKEVVIGLFIIFLMFHKDIFSTYNKYKYRKIERGNTESTNIKTSKSIPKVIYKTGIDDFNNVPDSVMEVFRETIQLNPDFKINYFSDEDSRNFIKNNFNNHVMIAYDKLVPGAYKADLFRYCILYKYGGIYSDLTQRIVKPLEEFIDFNKDNLYLVKDINHFNANGQGISKGIQISFMASVPGNDIFLKAINKVVENVNRKHYGENPLHPTGPSLFYDILQKYKNKYKIGLKETGKNKIVDDNDEIVIISKIPIHQTVILRNKDHYTILWRNRRIYKL